MDAVIFFGLTGVASHAAEVEKGTPLRFADNAMRGRGSEE
jgi:hypothetical protein